MEKILLVGDNFSLLATRVAILAKMSAGAVGCNPAELATHLGNEKFDVVILCHTLHESTRRSVIANARRRWPEVRILQILPRMDKTSPTSFLVDEVASTEPDDLIRRTAKLLGRPPRSQPPSQLSNVA